MGVAGSSMFASDVEGACPTPGGRFTNAKLGFAGARGKAMPDRRRPPWDTGAATGGGGRPDLSPLGRDVVGAAWSAPSSSSRPAASSSGTEARASGSWGHPAHSVSPGGPEGAAAQGPDSGADSAPGARTCVPRWGGAPAGRRSPWYSGVVHPGHRTGKSPPCTGPGVRRRTRGWGRGAEGYPREDSNVGSSLKRIGMAHPRAPGYSTYRIAPPRASARRRHPTDHR